MINVEIRLFNHSEPSRRLVGAYRQRALPGPARGARTARPVSLLETAVVQVADVSGGSRSAFTLGREQLRPGSLAGGACTFRDLRGPEIDLLVLVPRPDGNLTSAALTVRQRFRVVESAARGSRRAVRVEPVPFPEPGTAERRWAAGRHLHPRIIEPLTVSSDHGRPTVRIWIDATFLDMTRYPATRRLPEPGAPMDMRVFEYTAGTPIAWCVAVPRNLQQRSRAVADVGAMVFFRPRLWWAYQRSEQLLDAFDFGQWGRYVKDPPAGLPWYVGARGGRVGYFFAPACGWGRQLASAAEAGRPCIYIDPQPHDTNFGVAAGGLLRPLLGSLMRAMWANACFGPDPLERATLARLALSGFSFGGTAMFSAFRALSSHVDELYLFDPNGLSDTAGRSVRQWFFASHGRERRLRMFGGLGDKHQAMMGLRASILRDPRMRALPSADRERREAQVSVEPGSSGYWHEPSSYFSRAIGWDDPERRLSAVSGRLPAAAGVSRRTDVYDADPRSAGPRMRVARLVSMSAHGPVWDGPITVRCSRAELEMLLSYYQPLDVSNEFLTGAFHHGEVANVWPTGRDPRPRDQRRQPRPMGRRPMRFAEIPHQVEPRVHSGQGLRHQWAVIGGSPRQSGADASRSTADRNPSSFLGHLEAALRASGFTPG